MGLDHHYEDFGQTLGRWGVGAGAYVVLPLLGPSTVRDAAALPLDRLATPPALSSTTTATQIRHSRRCRSSTRASSLLGATPRDRRHRARQVHLHSRRLPAAAPQPGLRRRRARRGRAGARRAGRWPTPRRRASAPHRAGLGAVADRIRRAGCPALTVTCPVNSSAPVRSTSVRAHWPPRDERELAIAARSETTPDLARCRPPRARRRRPRRRRPKAPDALIKEVSTDVLDAVKADKIDPGRRCAAR